MDKMMNRKKHGKKHGKTDKPDWLRRAEMKEFKVGDVIQDGGGPHMVTKISGSFVSFLGEALPTHLCHYYSLLRPVDWRPVEGERVVSISSSYDGDDVGFISVMCKYDIRNLDNLLDKLAPAILAEPLLPQLRRRAEGEAWFEGKDKKTCRNEEATIIEPCLTNRSPHDTTGNDTGKPYWTHFDYQDKRVRKLEGCLLTEIPQLRGEGRTMPEQKEYDRWTSEYFKPRRCFEHGDNGCMCPRKKQGR